MTSPYKKHLLSFKGMRNVITIDRDGATSVTGRVIEVEDDSCVIESAGAQAGTVTNTFIAYEDIRGVSQVEADMT